MLQLQDTLTHHVDSVHKKIRHPCLLCTHQATTQESLKRHIHSVHKKIKYSCDLCDHQKYMKKSNILVIYESIKLPHKEVWELILSLSMKISNFLVICVMRQNIFLPLCVGAYWSQPVQIDNVGFRIYSGSNLSVYWRYLHF